jgi:hypothetical protein
MEVLGREVLIGIDDRNHRPREFLVDQACTLGPGAL